MTDSFNPVETSRKVTNELAAWIAHTHGDDITSAARTRARHALLDWTGVSIAGAQEPLTRMLVDELGSQFGQASLVNHPQRANLIDAALINGAASHALDYDDVNERLHGHPGVAVIPAALALAEQRNMIFENLLNAIVVGTEMCCLIGTMADPGHYEAGFHATGTVGSFGAMAAAAHLLELDATQNAHAFGITASQAAGLKANFGTMTKPLHAGKAAANGLLAARLAARGFTANSNSIECDQGIASAMMPGFKPDHCQPWPDGYFAIQQNLFKYHAACYMTHAMIEAIVQIRDQHILRLDDLESLNVQVHHGHLRVCNIENPVSGLESKFSLKHCAAMALAGIDTGALDSYSDACANDPTLVAAREKINIEVVDIWRMAVRVKMQTRSGSSHTVEHDVGKAEVDDQRQQEKLLNKFSSLCLPMIGASKSQDIAHFILQADGASSVTDFTQLLRS